VDVTDDDIIEVKERLHETYDSSEDDQKTKLKK
jgi:hypothetical protein